MGMAVHTCARLLASERDTGGRQQEGLGAGGTVLPSAAYESTMPACVADANSSAIASMLPLHTTDCFTAFCDVFNVVVSGIEAVLLQHDQASFHRTNHLPLQSCTAGCCSLWMGGCTCPPACPSGWLIPPIHGHSAQRCNFMHASDQMYDDTETRDGSSRYRHLQHVAASDFAHERRATAGHLSPSGLHIPSKHNLLLKRHFPNNHSLYLNAYAFRFLTFLYLRAVAPCHPSHLQKEQNTAPYGRVTQTVLLNKQSKIISTPWGTGLRAPRSVDRGRSRAAPATAAPATPRAMGQAITGGVWVAWMVRERTDLSSPQDTARVVL